MASNTGTCLVSIILAAPFPSTARIHDLVFSVSLGEPCWSSSLTLGSQALRSARSSTRMFAQGQLLGDPTYVFFHGTAPLMMSPFLSLAETFCRLCCVLISSQAGWVYLGDLHMDKTTGTSGALTIWLCCSWNKLLVCLAGGELALQLSLVSPKVFSPFCHRWSFGSLPLSPLACLVGESSIPAKSSTWLHIYYLNWTELDNAITKFNNEMHSAENWVLNPVILHYWHNLPILILCRALLQFVLLKALYK